MVESLSSSHSASIDHQQTPAVVESRRESVSTMVTATMDSDKQPKVKPTADVEKAEQLEANLPEAAPTTSKDPFLVRFDEGDLLNPKNWSMTYRAFCTVQLSLLATVASMASSIISPAADVLAHKFDISDEIVIFNVSLFVLAFALGPLYWAGISETFGRKWSLLPAVFGMAVFSIGSAVSNSASALFVTRFFAGLFGSGPVSNVAASLGDMYKPKQRGVAVSLYALAVIGGPTMGTVIGAALTEKVSWRWTEYVIAIWAFALCAFCFFFLPETYAPVLLKRKAERLRKETGNNAFHHPHEDVKLDPKSILTHQVTRPLRMLFTEPIVTVIALYASFVYSLLYMTLEIFPLIFATIRGWGPIVSTLPFIAVLVGIACALVVNLGNAHWYNKAVDKNGGKPAPDARLPPIIIGAAAFSGGLFWMGWTAAPRFPWILPVLAAAFIGGGFNIVFQQCINYLIDSYTLYAASAISANTFLRSTLAATLPFAVRPMFNALGPGRAMSILGAVAAVAIPLPLLFMKIGRSLRRRSKFAQE